MLFIGNSNRVESLSHLVKTKGPVYPTRLQNEIFKHGKLPFLRKNCSLIWPPIDFCPPHQKIIIVYTDLFLLLLSLAVISLTPFYHYLKNRLDFWMLCLASLERSRLATANYNSSSRPRTRHLLPALLPCLCTGGFYTCLAQLVLG